MSRSRRDATKTSGKVLSGGKRLVFKIISILLPFLILFLIEISLRIFHYGYDLNLFIEARNNPDYLVLNPEASKRYFTNEAFAPTGNSELFRKNKDSTTLRIFVLGESTTIGYPYFHNGSFHRWLQYRLMRTFPNRQFEIINLSVTAVNSYTVLGFAKEIIDYKPDAVLIYSGHNEFYGTLGVGSTNRIGNNGHIIRLMLFLRQFRIVQLLTNIYQKIKNIPGSNSKYSGQTLMQRMVADQQIAFGSKLFNKGIDQFVGNMNETLDLFNSHHIPVFVSNLVSNERDLKPFVSVPADTIHLPEFEKNFNAGVKAFDQGRWESALGYFSLANKIYDAHALCNFYLGRLSVMQGDQNKAKFFFNRAKDLDGLRFRAPTLINDAISKLCSKYKYAHLVDTKAVFDSCSVNHIIGNELMLEHVHPNLAGYALISDVFYEALKKEQIISPAKENELTFGQLIQTMPITLVDSLTGIYRISKLKESWPFSSLLIRDSLDISSEEEKLADSIAFQMMKWPYAMDALYNYYVKRNDLLKAKTVMETLALEYPTEAHFYESAATIDGKLGNYEDAAFYFSKAFAIRPSFPVAKTLFVIYLKLDKPAHAMPYLDYAIQNNASNVNFLPVKKFAVEIIGLQKESKRDSMNLPILNLIANMYMRMGNTDGATIYLNKILKADPKNKEALNLLGQIKKG